MTWLPARWTPMAREGAPCVAQVGPALLHEGGGGQAPAVARPARAAAGGRHCPRRGARRPDRADDAGRPGRAGPAAGRRRRAASETIELPPGSGRPADDAAGGLAAGPRAPRAQRSVGTPLAPQRGPTWPHSASQSGARSCPDNWPSSNSESSLESQNQGLGPTGPTGPTQKTRDDTDTVFDGCQQTWRDLRLRLGIVVWWQDAAGAAWSRALASATRTRPGARWSWT
jgi:hypothetical protein